MSGLTTVEILRGAREALAERGWHKGWYFPLPPGGTSDTVPPPDCPVCLLGALDVGGGNTPGHGVNVGVERALLDILAERGVELPLGPWNDEPERTLDEVFALLDEAIARAESDGAP